MIDFDKLIERHKLTISYLKGEIGIEKLNEKRIKFANPFKNENK